LKFLLLCSVVLFGFFVFFITTDMFDTRPTASVLLEDALYRDPSQPIEARVADLLSYMTLEEKIGQMALVEKNSIQVVGDISDYHLGALLSGSGTKPPENIPSGWRSMIETFQAEAAASRLRIPLLYGTDAIHGHAHVPGATVFPHAIGLGASRNSELTRRVGYATAEQLKTTNVNWNFAPNLDQPQDIRWGRVYEAFSDDPEVVSSLGAAYINGLQTGMTEGSDVRVLATAKHYLGLGSMQWGTSINADFKIDQGVTPESEALLRSQHLPPFIDAIDAGVLSVMVGLNSWGNTRMVSEKHLLTNVLKNELGFKGFVVSDWYGVHEGKQNTFFATVSAVNAGVDMLMLPFDYKAFMRHMKWANRLGLVSDERIDDAVGRILYAKFALGLFDEKEKTGVTADISNSAHRDLAREAVAQSSVLLQNTDSVLPLKPSIRHIRVAGSAADNVGRQSGAWTVEWQGVDGNWLPGGTSILAGLRARAGGGVEIEYEATGHFSEDQRIADVGIAVVGEKPYAEGWGDKAHPTLDPIDLAAIERLQEISKKVVVVIVSGRPLLVTDEIGSWNGVVAAWLPGSEGAGVADVLFGDRPFVGTLPLPWPSHSEQLPISAEEETSDGTEPLFQRGFGLK
jgi:beta-glucosidase